MRFRGGVCQLADTGKWHVCIAIDDRQFIAHGEHDTEAEALEAYNEIRPILLQALGQDPQ